MVSSGDQTDRVHRKNRAAGMRPTLVITGLIVCALLQAGQSVSSSKSQQITPETGKRELFSAFDLSLLETPDREQWQRTDDILDDLKIADGSTVADIAAGGGW